MICLQISQRKRQTKRRDRLAVWQRIFYDGVTITLEHDRGATQLPDLLIGPFDHSVALAPLGIEHFTCRGDLKPLFGSRFGFQFGHLLVSSPGGKRPNILLAAAPPPRLTAKKRSQCSKTAV